MEANGRTGQVMSESSDSCWFLLREASTSSDDVGLVRCEEPWDLLERSRHGRIAVKSYESLSLDG